MDELPRNCCPICGLRFEDIYDENICKNCLRISKDSELINEEEDYEWCY